MSHALANPAHQPRQMDQVRALTMSFPPQNALVPVNQLRRTRPNASSAAQGLCHDDQQRRSQGEMGRTEGLCEARYQGLTYAGATRPPIIIYCRTPHTRLSGASSATAAVPLSSTIIIFCHG